MVNRPGAADRRLAPGTLISSSRDMSAAVVTCIVLKPHVTVMDIVSTKMLGQFGFLVPPPPPQRARFHSHSEKNSIPNPFAALLIHILVCSCSLGGRPHTPHFERPKGLEPCHTIHSTNHDCRYPNPSSV